ncbi:MAG TPA: beta-propeller domain-containing protein, partial [Polyangiales bacterium]
LVLAQPDYRWMGDGLGDVGFLDEQRTSLHVFALSQTDTKYLASGFVAGHLPNFNPQFGLDVTEDHALRIASTGRVRVNPKASRNDPDFWATDTRNVVSVLREDGDSLKLVGTSPKLGLPGESVFSARFVGPRAYVVTFRQTDPLYALDVSGDQPELLGELKIPGFSQYMHPLDDDHLITFGQSGTGGSQLQLFDVSDPKNLPLPKTLDFGGGSGSEVANQHKAFTFYGPQSLIALPVSGSRMLNNSYSYMAALRVIRVNKETGFELVGSIDHSGFYGTSQNTGCFNCGPWGCNNFCPDYGGSNVRRGHFVEDEESTYVYAIGSAGVTVSDLGDLSTNIAEVRLPAVNFSSSPWYTDGTSGGGTMTEPGSRPAGGSVGGGSTGTGSVGVGTSLPPVTEPTPPRPTMTPAPDAPPAPATDAGVATPAP